MNKVASHSIAAAGGALVTLAICLWWLQPTGDERSLPDAPQRNQPPIKTAAAPVPPPSEPIVTPKSAPNDGGLVNGPQLIRVERSPPIRKH